MLIYINLDKYNASPNKAECYRNSNADLGCHVIKTAFNISLCHIKQH